VRKSISFAIVVAFALVFASSSAASAATSSDLLPDLGIEQISHIFLDTTFMPGHVLLRYGVKLPDAGAGPLRIRATRPDTTQSDLTVKQQIAQTGGGYRTVGTTYTMEYRGGEWRLGDLEAGWLQNGSGSHVAALAKHWYCPADDLEYDLDLPNAPQSPVYTGCAAGNKTLLAVTVGVSVGWADNYYPRSWMQYIDITGLSDGTYTLYAQADPDGYILESDESNNVTWTKIQISNGTVTILGYGPHI
jgi:hypothetical protein